MSIKDKIKLIADVILEKETHGQICPDSLRKLRGIKDGRRKER